MRRKQGVSLTQLGSVGADRGLRFAGVCSTWTKGDLLESLFHGLSTGVVLRVTREKLALEASGVLPGPVVDTRALPGTVLFCSTREFRDEL